MKRLKLILLIILVLTKLLGYSQGNFRKAYIVNNNNDTIIGFIDYTSPKSISANCFFQKDSNRPIINYKPSDLKGFCFDGGKRFVSKEVACQDTTATLFLEFLLKGVVNLYYCKCRNEDVYFIEKDSVLYPLSNDEVLVHDNYKTYASKSHKYIGVLKFLLNDEVSLSNEIENTDLYFTPLIRLLKDYHNQKCSNESCIVYYKKENTLNDTKWKIRYGFSMEYSFTKLKQTSKTLTKSIPFSNESNTVPKVNYFGEFDNFRNVETNTNNVNDYNCLFPVFFINFNRNSSSSFQLELKYKYLKYSLLNFNVIEIPVMYNYDFMYYKKVRPFINVGLSNLLIFGSHINGMYYKYDKLEGATFNTNHFEPIYSTHTDYINRKVPEMNGYNWGFNLGCGVGYTLPKKNILKLEFRSQKSIYIINGVSDGGITYESKLENPSWSILLS